MPAYIYYTSSTPVGVEAWEIHYVNDTVIAFDLFKNISDGGLIQVGQREEETPTARHLHLLFYFENRQTLDLYLSNNPVNVMSICSNPSTVEYCQNNNIIYNISSIVDTSDPLNGVIYAIDGVNFNEWTRPYESA